MGSYFTKQTIDLFACCVHVPFVVLNACFVHLIVLISLLAGLLGSGSWCLRSLLKRLVVHVHVGVQPEQGI